MVLETGNFHQFQIKNFYPLSTIFTCALPTGFIVDIFIIIVLILRKN